MILSLLAGNNSYHKKYNIKRNKIIYIRRWSFIFSNRRIKI